ncbi:hypothetical protein M8J77_001197 [Diaphorina citri]|nr:hypothetical protein M8J77_001197 [Diaphorina citri]
MSEQATTGLTNLNKITAVNTVQKLTDNTVYDCKKCGKRHGKRECPAYDKRCSGCGAMGHFKVGCRKKDARKVNMIQTEIPSNYSPSSSSETPGYFSVNQLNGSNTSHVIEDCWVQTVSVEGFHINFKLDSGAAVNVIPLDVIKSIKKEGFIKPVQMKIVAYGGYVIAPTLSSSVARFETLNCCVIKERGSAPPRQVKKV